jgi:hypothetical protein
MRDIDGTTKRVVTVDTFSSRLNRVRRQQAYELQVQTRADRLQLTGRQVGALHRWMPWAEPGVLSGLAAAGISIHDERSREIGAMAAAERLTVPHGFNAPGERVMGTARPKAVPTGGNVAAAGSRVIRRSQDALDAGRPVEAQVQSFGQFEARYPGRTRADWAQAQRVGLDVYDQAQTAHAEQARAQAAAQYEESNVAAEPFDAVRDIASRVGSELNPSVGDPERMAIIGAANEMWGGAAPSGMPSQDVAEGLLSGLRQVQPGWFRREIRQPHNAPRSPTPADMEAAQLVTDRLNAVRASAETTVRDMENQYGRRALNEAWQALSTGARHDDEVNGVPVADLARWDMARVSTTTPDVRLAGLVAQDDLGRFLTGTLRTAGMVVDAPYREFQSLFRSAYAVGNDPTDLGRWGDLALDTGSFAAAGGAAFAAGASAPVALTAGAGGMLISGVALGNDETELGVALEALSRGREVDTGTGIFVDPDSEVGRESLRRMRKAGLIGGHVVTPGRFAGDLLFEPDTGAFDVLSGVVDMALALKEPSGIATDEAFRGARSLRSGEVLADAGGLAGTTRVVDPARFTEWAASPHGTDFVNFVSNVDATDSRAVYDAWVAGGRSIDPRVMDQLTTGPVGDFAHVRGVLDRELGIGLRDAPTTPAAWREGIRAAPRHRLFTQMPGDEIPIVDAPQAVRQVENILRTINAPTDMVADFTVRAMRAYDWPGDANTALGMVPSSGRWMDLVEDLMGATDGLLHSAGVDDASLRRGLTRMWRRGRQDEFMGWLDDTGRRVAVTPIVGGVPAPLGNPHLTVEMLASGIPVPNMRTLRRLTASPPVRALQKYGGIVTNEGELRLLWRMADGFMSNVWKAGQLAFRFPAWVGRVVGEEQMRMAATGLDSMFRHPISYISRVLADPTGLRGSMEDAFEFQQSLSRGPGWWMGSGPARSRTGEWVSTRAGTTDYTRGVTEEIAKLRLAEESRFFARNGHDETIRALESGELRRAAHRLEDAGFPMAVRRPPGAPTWTARHAAGDDEIRSLDDFVESIGVRMDDATGGDPRLLELIRQGVLDGHTIESRVSAGFDKKLVRAVDNIIAEHPDRFPSEIAVEAVSATGSPAAGAWNEAINAIFGYTMGATTDKLSRSQAFRQFYWRRAEELVPYAEPSVQGELAAAAVTAKPDPEWVFAGRKIRSTTPDRMAEAAAAGHVGSLTFDEVDVLAKAHALDQVRRLLYDTAERSNFMDAFRLVFPFGEAWREVAGRWATLAPANPRLARNLYRGIDSAQSAGIFTTDDYGEEVLVVPGTGWLTRELIGREIPLQMSVKGLSIAPIPGTGTGEDEGLGSFLATISPGMGPAVQLPASWVLPHRPQYDGLRAFLLPFGEDKDPMSLVLPRGIRRIAAGMQSGEELSTRMGYDFSLLGLPEDVSRGLAQAVGFLSADPDSDRQFGNTVGWVMRGLASSGDYDLAGGDPGDAEREMRRLIEDAVSGSTELFMIRGLAGVTLPSRTSPQWTVDDKNGRATLAIELSDDLQAMKDEDPTTAEARFIAKWGADNFLLLQGFSAPRFLDAVSSREAMTWAQEHGDVMGDYPDTWGLFAPDGETFSPDAYAWSVATGQREVMGRELDPRSWFLAAQDRRARIIYNRAIEEVGDDLTTDSGRAYLAEVRTYLYDTFPGYGAPSLGSDYTQQDLQNRVIPRLRDAAEDPRLADSEAADGLRVFLPYWDEAVADESSHENPTGAFWSGDAGLGRRNWIRYEVAPAIMRDHPEFADVYDRVFDRVMDRDEEEG